MHFLPCLERQAPESPSIFRITQHWLVVHMLAQVQVLYILGMAQAQAQVVRAGAGIGIGPGSGFGGHGPAR